MGRELGPLLNVRAGGLAGDRGGELLQQDAGSHGVCCQAGTDSCAQGVNRVSAGREVGSPEGCSAKGGLGAIGIRLSF